MTLASLRISHTPPRAAPRRYACYPTLGRFRAEVGAARADAWIAALPAGARLSLRLHVPFCERLCWFCSSRTQRLRGPELVADYLAALAREAERLGARLPPGAQVVEIRWTGGTPTILAPAQMRALDRALRAALPVAPAARLAVEIEPQGLDPDRLDALMDVGLREAAIGLQDFDPVVQAAIGREITPGRFAATFDALRAAGVERIALELLFGLPGQSAPSIAATAAFAAGLGPDSAVLAPYAHVPWMAKRQRMIPLAALPDAALRRAQFAAGAAALRGARYLSCGAELFLRPGDPLAEAWTEGRLRRDLGTYGAGEEPAATIGLGPAAVSRFPQGYVQNVAETGAYLARLAAGAGAGERGFVFGLEDRIRGRAIEMLFCALRVDLPGLRAEFGDFAEVITDLCAAAARAFPGRVSAGPAGLAVDPAAPFLAPRVAEFFDAFADA